MEGKKKKNNKLMNESHSSYYGKEGNGMRGKNNKNESKKPLLKGCENSEVKIWNVTRDNNS